jgi:mannosyltransferase OCH1-like enzyme
MAIPKKIHYCWLSGEEMPDDTIKCMETWKKIMPEYELVLWDKNKFDINSIEFTREACNVKKWAFAADYIRMYALYTEGGIYMDTDVYVKKSFDRFLDNDFFTSLEYHKEMAIKQNAFELLNENGTIKNQRDRIFTRSIGIQAAVLGGIKGHPFLKSCLDWYKDKHFILPDGTYYNKIISPAIYADVMIEYGFRYKDEIQKLGYGMMVYPSGIFAGCIQEAGEESYAIHCCNGSWREKPKETILKKIKRKLAQNNFLRKILGKKAYINIEDV